MPSSSQGHVRSIDGLRDLQAATLKLAARYDDLAATLRNEQTRAERWITEEAPRYWRAQQRRAEQRLSEAEDTLAALQSTANDQNQAGVSECRQRVIKARERVRLCESKLRVCRTVALELERAGERLHAASARLQHQADTHLPAAGTRLKNWIAALDRYTESTAQSGTQNHARHDEQNKTSFIHPDAPPPVPPENHA